MENFNYNVYTIFIFYNPNEEQIKRIDNYAVLNKTIVVDNSEISLEHNYHFDYLPQLRNLGIADAQNIGIKYAIEKKADYIIFFDQDSNIEIDYSKRIIDEYLVAKSTYPNIGMLGPLIIDEKTKSNFITQNKSRFIEQSYLISSGLLIEVEIIKKIGYLDSKLFIDYVDFEWCWRSQRSGYLCLITTNIHLLHSIGYIFYKFCGLQFHLSAPKRYFYQYRNFIILLARDYVPFKWKVRGIVRKFLDIIVISIIALKKVDTIKYIIKGIIIGFIELLKWKKDTSLFL